LGSISLAARHAPAVVLCSIGLGVMPMMLRPCEPKSKGPAGAAEPGITVVNVEFDPR
jgi:hypothetical protein